MEPLGEKEVAKFEVRNSLYRELVNIAATNYQCHSRPISVRDERHKLQLIAK